MCRLLPRFTSFPYTTLFRSRVGVGARDLEVRVVGVDRLQLDGRHRDVRERNGLGGARHGDEHVAEREGAGGDLQDRKSTRLNSSHVSISYAVFCLKKKNIIK